MKGNHVPWPETGIDSMSQYLSVEDTLKMFTNYWWKDIGCKQFGRAVWLPHYGDCPNERKRKRMEKEMHSAEIRKKRYIEETDPAKARAIEEETLEMIAKRKEDYEVQLARNQTSIEMWKKIPSRMKNNELAIKKKFDQFWPPEKSELSKKEEKELKAFLKTKKGKAVEARYLENEEEVEQVSQLQYHKLGNPKYNDPYYSARIADPKKKYGLTVISPLTLSGYIGISMKIFGKWLNANQENGFQYL